MAEVKEIIEKKESAFSFGKEEMKLLRDAQT